MPSRSPSSDQPRSASRISNLRGPARAFGAPSQHYGLGWGYDRRRESMGLHLDPLEASPGFSHLQQPFISSHTPIEW